MAKKSATKTGNYVALRRNAVYKSDENREYVDRICDKVRFTNPAYFI